MEIELKLLGSVMLVIVLLAFVFMLAGKFTQEEVKVTSVMASVNYGEGGYPSSLTVANGGDTEVEEIKIKIVHESGSAERVVPVKITPGSFEIIDLREHFSEEELEKAEIIEVYADGKLIMRKIAVS